MWTKKILKYGYDLSSLMQKEKSVLKIKAGSLVFGPYTSDYNIEGFNMNVIEFVIKGTPPPD